MLVSQVIMIYWTLKELRDEEKDGVTLERLADELSIRRGNSDAIKYLIEDEDLHMLRNRLGELSCVEEIDGHFYLLENESYSPDKIIDSAIRTCLDK